MGCDVIRSMTPSGGRGHRGTSARFPGQDGRTCEHVMAPPSWLPRRRHTGSTPQTVERTKQVLDDWAEGAVDWRTWNDAAGRYGVFASFVGAAPESIALGPATASLVGVLAAGLPPGAEVLTPSGEFTSLLFRSSCSRLAASPFAKCRWRRSQTRSVHGPRPWRGAQCSRRMAGSPTTARSSRRRPRWARSRSSTPRKRPAGCMFRTTASTPRCAPRTSGCAAHAGPPSWSRVVACGGGVPSPRGELVRRRADALRVLRDATAAGGRREAVRHVAGVVLVDETR